MKNLSETDKAYLAGLVDGEGHIGISLSSKGHFNGRVKINMTDKPTMEWCVETTGVGYLELVKPQGDFKHRHKISYKWRLGRDLGGQLLLQLLPYLKTKRKQAESFLEFIEICKERRGKERSERKMVLYNTMKVLNS